MEETPASETAAARGELFVLSAPSGTGKTTLIKRLFEGHPDVAEGLVFSVSHTTRAPRPGEIHGRDYYFIDLEAFERLIDASAFLEWAEVHGELKGTSRAEIDRLLAGGRDVLLDIDVQGAQQVLDRHPHWPSIFVLPPSYEEMERRLRSRGLDAPEQIERRLSNARQEIRCWQRYEYVIVNDVVERATAALAAIFRARRLRRVRMQRQIQRVLAGFPPPERSPAGSRRP